MPKFLEDKLKAEAAKKGFKGRRADRYTYGAMNNMGAMQGSEVTAKGMAMEKKHKADMARKKMRKPMSDEEMRKKRAEMMLGKGARAADRG